MEADWEVEIGPGAPIIDASWAGLVDLRQRPELAPGLPEVDALPGLAEGLMRLNGAGSPVWTAKCDVWVVPNADELDPYELDADPGSVAAAAACYIDLLPGASGPWSEPETAATWCRRFCDQLSSAKLSNCRVDLIVRRAVMALETDVLESGSVGITAYLTACGGTEEEANQMLGRALRAFTGALAGDSTLK